MFRYREYNLISSRGVCVRVCKCEHIKSLSNVNDLCSVVYIPSVNVHIDSYFCQTLCLFMFFFYHFMFHFVLFMARFPV